MGAKALLARLREDVAALIYPPQCSHCGAVETGAMCRFLCDRCWQQLQNEAVPLLRRADDVPSHASPLAACDFDLAAWHYAVSSLQTLIPQMKYHAHPSFAASMGEWAARRMAPQLRHLFAAQPLLLPVPLHPTRQRERGFNQSELIARALATAWHVELQPHGLLRLRYTKQQALLGAEERVRNVHGAFGLHAALNLATRTVLLVDDVITTGATMSACARVVKEHGASCVGALALARVTNH